MTLDEAIKRAEEVAEEHEINARLWHKHAINTLAEAIKPTEEVAEEHEINARLWHKLAINTLADFFDNAIQEESKCKKCAEEHRQLAEWLKDYKRLLKQ